MPKDIIDLIDGEGTGFNDASDRIGVEAQDFDEDFADLADVEDL